MYILYVNGSMTGILTPDEAASEVNSVFQNAENAGEPVPNVKLVPYGTFGFEM